MIPVGGELHSHTSDEDGVLMPVVLAGRTFKLPTSESGDGRRERLKLQGDSVSGEDDQ